MKQLEQIRAHVIEHATSLLNLSPCDAERLSLREIVLLLERHAVDVRARERAQELEAAAVQNAVVTAADLEAMSDTERRDVRRGLDVLDQLGRGGAGPLTPRTRTLDSAGTQWPRGLVLALAKLVEIAARQHELLSMVRRELAGVRDATLAHGVEQADEASANSWPVAASGFPRERASTVSLSPAGRAAVSEIESLGSYIAVLGSAMNIDLSDLHARLDEMARADLGARSRERTLRLQTG